MKAYGITGFLVNVLRESQRHISHRFRRAAFVVHESEVMTRTRDTGRQGGRVRWVRCVVICAVTGGRERKDGEESESRDSRHGHTATPIASLA